MRQSTWSNQSYPEGRVSVLYDLLNDLALDAHLAPGRRAETELAREHLCQVQPGDVVLTDRGYRGWGWFAEVQSRGGHFVCRCPRGSFKAVQELFVRDEAGVSVLVKLPAPKPERARARTQGRLLEWTVRLVTVRLCTGELEVLATSLLDEIVYPTECFGELYGWRWGQETHYGRLAVRAVSSGATEWPNTLVPPAAARAGTSQSTLRSGSATIGPKTPTARHCYGGRARLSLPRFDLGEGRGRANLLHSLS